MHNDRMVSVAFKAVMVVDYINKQLTGLNNV